MIDIILAVDFDGTLIYDCYPNPPTPDDIIPGAVDAIKKLIEQGHTLILWTCRSAEYETEAWEFCQSSGMKFHYLNANTTEILAEYGRDNRKIHADIYIDDKQIGGLPPWWKIMELVEEKERNG